MPEIRLTTSGVEATQKVLEKFTPEQTKELQLAATTLSNLLAQYAPSPAPAD
jgi:hypothetical protein